MGFMDFLTGGSKQKGTGLQGRVYLEMLGESMFPGLWTGGHRGGAQNRGASGVLTDYVNNANGGGFTSTLTGINDGQPQDFSNSSFLNFDPTQMHESVMAMGGPRTTNPDGSLQSLIANNPNIALQQTRGAEGMGGSSTLLPSFADMGNYDTLFEKADMGKLSPTGNAVMHNALKLMSEPVGLSQSAMASIAGASPGELPELPSVGEITTQIYNEMPEEFRTYTQDILNSASTEQMDAELDKFTEALITAENEQINGDSGMAREILSTFAARGATAGTAVAALKSVAVESIKNTNVTIANARLGALQSLLAARDQGTAIMNSLLQAGSQEQANIARSNIAELEAHTAIQIQKIQAAVQANQNLTQIQVAQMNLTGNLFQGLLSESQNENSQLNAAQQMPYNVLLGAAGASGGESSSSSGIGSLLPNFNIGIG